MIQWGTSYLKLQIADCQRVLILILILFLQFITYH